MSQHQYFMDAIIAEPEEDAHRLVYADYLEEQGDPRGEFIRLQVERKKMIPFTAEHEASVRRERDLLETHEKEWDVGLGAPAGQKLVYDRGFVRHIEMRATQFLKEGDGLLKRTPLETIRLPFLKGQVHKLKDAGLLQDLRGINLSGLKFPFEQLELMIESMPRMIRLNAKHARHTVDDRYAKLLVDSPAFERLEHLQMSSINSSFYRVIKAAGGFPSLKSFRFGNADMGGPRPKYFGSMDWSSLEHLQVNGTLRVADMEELAHLAPLKHVEFRYGSIPQRGLKAMIEAGCFAQAERIVFFGSQLSEKALTALLNSDLSQCRYLYISNPMDLPSDDFCHTVASAASLTSLEMFAGVFSPEQQTNILSDLPCKQLRSAHIQEFFS